MTVEDLEDKRDDLKNVSGVEHREMIAAIYNVGIAIVEALNAETKYDGSIFEQVFGGKK